MHLSTREVMSLLNTIKGLNVELKIESGLS